MKNISIILGLVTFMSGRFCFAAPLFPDIPERNLSHIRVLPKQTPVILEVRSKVLSGDPVSPPGAAKTGSIDAIGIEIGVFDLSNHSESVWDLPEEITPRVKMSCNDCTMRASWSSRTRQLFLALAEGGYLIDDTGNHTGVNIKLPGVSIPYVGADHFVLSEDGLLLAFKLLDRDTGDKSPNADDPYAAKYGKLYNSIVYEDIRGSIPVEIAKERLTFGSNGQPNGNHLGLPAWSPDHRKIAYCKGNYGKGLSVVVIADIGEDGLVSTGTVKTIPIPNPGYYDVGVKELRWSPDGNKLAFIVIEYDIGQSKQRTKHLLYTVDAEGQGLNAVQFGGDTDINVTAFAWSPSGDKFVLRSDYQAKPICNFNLMFYMQTERRPCRISEHLFTSNLDGSGLKRITKEPEYRHGQLFWIQ